MILLVLPLLFGAPVAAESLGPPRAVDAQEAASFEALSSRYDEAVLQWKSALSAETDRDKKRALRKQKPAIEFYPKFSALADAGEGRALLWMIERCKDAGHKSRDAKQIRAKLAARLVKEHVNAEWFGDAVPVLFKNKSSIGVDGLEALSNQIFDKCSSPVVQAKTMSELAAMLSRSKGEGHAEKGAAYFERLDKEFTEEVLGQALSGVRFRDRFLVVGKVVPDFTAETVDGEAFKLSDYRGKVTLIDFWGFW